MLINTARTPWVSLKSAVASDDTAITDFKRANWPSSNIIKLAQPPLQDANGLIICGYGTDAANEVLTSYKLLGIARNRAPIFTLFSGVMTLGTLACSVNPIGEATLTNGLWVDTITVTGGFLDGQHDILDSANNRICGLKFDQGIFDELYLEIDIDTMASFYAIIAGY